MPKGFLGLQQVFEDGEPWASHWDKTNAIRCQTPAHLEAFAVLNMRPNDFTCDAPLIQTTVPLNITTFLHESVVLKVMHYNTTFTCERTC